MANNLRTGGQTWFCLCDTAHFLDKTGRKQGDKYSVHTGNMKREQIPPTMSQGKTLNENTTKHPPFNEQTRPTVVLTDL